MKFPWVSRETLEETKAAYQKALDAQATEIENLKWELEHEHSLTASVIEKYAALANPPVIHNLDVPRGTNGEKSAVSVITQAIRDESGGDQRLAAFLRKRSRDLKAEHPDWEDEQVAAELAKWETTEIPT
jgi:hypothetical protein